MNAIMSIWRGENAKAEKAKRALETAFLALSGLYLIYLFTISSTLFFPYPRRLETVMIVALAATAVPRLALIGPRKAALWLAAALALVYNAVHTVDGYGFLWFLAVLTAGCVGIDYRKILKTWLIAVGGALVVTVVAALAGAIQNIVYYRDGLRSSWGMSYPTDLASLALFLLMGLWATWKRLPDWAMLPLGAAGVALIIAVTLSRNVLICGAVFCAAMAYHWLEETARRRGKLRGLSKGVDIFLIASFPLFAAAILAMVFLYSRGLPLGQRLDGLMSGRLEQSLTGFRMYGVKAFGTPFDQIGNGFSVFPQKDANFIDSSYVLILLRYGWVLFLALCGLWAWTIRRALRCGDRRLALVMGVIALHSMLEHHFTEVDYNILLVMPFAAYAAAPEDGKGAPGWRGRVALPAALALFTVGACLAAPYVLTRLRTLFQAMGWTEGGVGPVFSAAVALAVVAWTAAVVWCLTRILASRGRDRLRSTAVLLLCAGVAGGGLAVINGVVGRAERENTALMDADAPAMELILAAAKNPVYADALPAVYQRRFEGIRDSALPLEDLARQAGSTVLTTADEERNAFFQCGFLYAGISPEHAVYSGDEAVIDALEGAGYAPKTWYDTRRDVDLEAAAELNGLEYSGEGLLLDGPDKSLAKTGPVDLFGGLYTAYYSLRLEPGASEEPGEVCRLRATAYEGETLLGELPVYREQFDAEGCLEVPLAFKIGNAFGVEFTAFAGEGRRVRVEAVSFGKTEG